MAYSVIGFDRNIHPVILQAYAKVVDAWRDHLSVSPDCAMRLALRYIEQ